jgi:hypothetical protein
MSLVLIIYPGISHEVEISSLNSFCQSPFGIVTSQSIDHWLVCKLIRELVCSLVSQIQSNDSPEFVFLLTPSSGSCMHLPIERLPIAPRAWKEPSLQLNLLLFNDSIIFLNAVSLQFAFITQQRHGSDKL